MKKRLVSTILAGAMSFMLVACGSASTETAEVAGEKTETEAVADDV